MQSISKYIQSNPVLRELDFTTVYTTIIELIKDNKAEFYKNVQICKQQSE